VVDDRLRCNSGDSRNDVVLVQAHGLSLLDKLVCVSVSEHLSLSGFWWVELEVFVLQEPIYELLVSLALLPMAPTLPYSCSPLV